VSGTTRVGPRYHGTRVSCPRPYFHTLGTLYLGTPLIIDINVHGHDDGAMSQRVQGEGYMAQGAQGPPTKVHIGPYTGQIGAI